jgi:hypothetical protein
MRQFSIGQVVTCIPDQFLRHAAPGNYRIIAAMPDRDGDHMYRIKSPLEEHERVVREGLLVESDGYLPEELPKRGAGRRSITIPTLHYMRTRSRA